MEVYLMGTEISAEERAKQINSRAETRIAKATESAKKLAEKEKALLQLQKEIAKEILSVAVQTNKFLRMAGADEKEMYAD